jgi:UDP-N-acetylglucosamine diphosphorylase/glucosamine-1-phosphate N-acetyltransferase
MKVCIFEDSFALNLSPLNDLRHTSELICGARTLKEKIEACLRGKYEISIHSRNYLSAYCKEKFPKTTVNRLYNDDYLFLNPRVIFSKAFIDGLLLTFAELENTCILIDGAIAAFHISSKRIPKLKQKIESPKGDNLISHRDITELSLKKIRASDLNTDEAEELKVIRYPSDPIGFHEDELNMDLEFLFAKKRNVKKHTRHSTPLMTGKAEFINRQRVFISQNCKIGPLTVFDASKGNIYISENVVIEPFSYIVGPVFIGAGATLRSGTKLYGPVSIGSQSKVSGEITCSILHSYINKQHLGFLGHSYLCEWVNLGAGTTTSNLKNNYSTISLTMRLRPGLVKTYTDSDLMVMDTGSIFLGSMIGDHTKTGINTMLNTGSLIGVSCNLYGGGFHMKFIDSFSWAEAGGETTVYDIEKARATARISMKRRNVQMLATYEEVFRYLFKNRKK